MKNIAKKLSTVFLQYSTLPIFQFSKLVSIAVVISLLLGTIGNNAYAVAQTINSEQKEENNISKFSEGKITNYKDADSIVTVVNIQDLHCHYQTQQNINNIIKEIDDNYGIKAICVEGGYGQIDTSWLNNIKDEQLKQAVTDKLFEEGELTGAEYYVIKNNKKDILKGLDDEKIHKENIKRLSGIIENENKYAKTLEKVKYSINGLNNKYVNGRSKKFTNIVNKYRQERIDTAEYYSLLYNYIDKINEEPQKYNNIINISKTDYPNISKYLQLTKNNKKVKTKKAAIELQQLLAELKQKLPYVEYSNMLADTKNLKQTDKLVSYIQYYNNENKINLEKYSQLNNFVQLNYINNSLNPVEMIKEEAALEDQIRKALSYNLTEYEIAYITNFEQYFEKYLNYGLTCIEWKYFEAGMEKFRKIYSKYAVIDRIKEIEKDFDNINKYYQVNETRNSIFIDNITKYMADNKKLNTKQKRTAEQILKDSKEVIVVVSGGYHSEELTDMLSDKNINDIVITPNVIGDTEISSEKYKQIIKGQGKIQSQALAYTLASCTTDKKQKELLIKTAVDIIGFDNISQLSDIFGEQIETEERVFKKAKNEFVIKTPDGEFIIANTINEEIVKSKIKEIIKIIFENNKKFLTEILLANANIFYPNNKIIDKLIIETGFLLNDMGFEFDNNGIIFDIENSDYSGADILGMSPEQYSNMSESFQKAVFKAQEKIDKNKKYAVVNIELSPDKQNYEIIGFHEKKGKGISAHIRKKNENNYSFFIDKNTIKDFYGYAEPTSTIQSDNMYVYEQIKNMKDNNLPFVSLGQLSDEHISILGKEQKNVVLKNNIVDKNLSHHQDVLMEQYGDLLETLKSPDYILQNESGKSNYYSFIKEIGNEEYSIIVPDRIEIQKDNLFRYNQNKEIAKVVFQDYKIENKEILSLAERFLSECENKDRGEALLEKAVYEYGVDVKYILNYFLEEENIEYINNTESEQIRFINEYAKYICLFIDSGMSLEDFCNQMPNAISELSNKGISAQTIQLSDELKIKNQVMDSLEYWLKFNSVNYKFNEINKLYFQYRKNKFLAPDFYVTLKKVEDYCYPVLEILGLDSVHVNMNLLLNMEPEKLEQLRVFLKSCSLKETDKIKNLFLSLRRLGYTAVDTDKNCLALKIFLNKYLDQMFVNLKDDSQYYKIALSVSQIIPDDIAENITDEIITDYLQLYIEPLQNYLTETSFEDGMDVYVGNAVGPAFSTDGMNLIKDRLSKLGININVIDKIAGKTISSSEKFLEVIKGSKEQYSDKSKKTMFLFNGHSNGSVLYFVNEENNNKEADFVTIKQLAHAIIEAKNNGAVMNNITINLASCISFHFAQRLINAIINQRNYELKAEGKSYKEAQQIIEKELNNKELIPVIITSTNKDYIYSSGTEFTDNDNKTYDLSTFEKAVIKYIDDNENEIKNAFSTKNLLLSGINYKYSTQTIIVYNLEFYNKKRELDNIVRKKLKIELPMFEEQDYFDKFLKFSLSILAPLKNTKIGSVLNKYAPILEEISFRTIPMAISPALFSVMQVLFLFSHTIVRWIYMSNETGNWNLKQLGKFAIEDLKNIGFPALLVTASYVIPFTILSMAFPFLSPLAAVIIPTLVSMAFHYIWNNYFVEKFNKQKLEIVGESNLTDENDNKLGRLFGEVAKFEPKRFEMDYLLENRDEAGNVPAKDMKKYIDILNWDFEYQGISLYKALNIFISEDSNSEDLEKAKNLFIYFVFGKLAEFSNFDGKEIKRQKDKKYKVIFKQQGKSVSDMSFFQYTKFSNGYTFEALGEYEKNGYIEMYNELIAKNDNNYFSQEELDFVSEQLNVKLDNELSDEMKFKVISELILNREKMLKVLSKYYAMYIWNKKYGSKEEVAIGNTNLKLRLKDWIHICDAHSPITINLEYSQKKFDLYNAKTSLEQLIDFNSTNELINEVYKTGKEEDNNGFKEYSKNIDGKKYVLVVKEEKNNKKNITVVTFYIQDEYIPDYQKFSILAPLKNTKIGSVLNKYAPILEEISFRTIPMVISPTLFSVMQVLFLFSHTIVRWIYTSNETGNWNLKQLGKFAIEDLKNLGIPALLVTASYVIPFTVLSMAFPFLSPLAAVIIPTLVSMAFHYIWNNYIVLKYGKQKLTVFEQNKRNAYLSLWENIKENENPHRWYMIEEFLENRNWFEQGNRNDFILENEDLFIIILESLFPRGKLSNYLKVFDAIESEGNKKNILKENNALLIRNFENKKINSAEDFKQFVEFLEGKDEFYKENKKLISLILFPLIKNDKLENKSEKIDGIYNLLYKNKDFIEENSDWLSMVYENNELTFTETVKLIDSFTNEENKEREKEKKILNSVNSLVKTKQKGDIVELLSSLDYLFEYLDDENNGTIITEQGIKSKVDDKLTLLLKRRNLQKLYENRELFTPKEQKKIFKNLKVTENILKINDFDKLNDVVKQMFLDGSIKSPANLKEFVIDFHGENLIDRQNPNLKRNTNIAKQRNLNEINETKILFNAVTENDNYQNYKNYNDIFIEITGFTIEQIIQNEKEAKDENDNDIINGRTYEKGEILEIYRDDIVYAIAKMAKNNNVNFKDIIKNTEIANYDFKCPLFDGPCLVPYCEILKAGYDIGDCTGNVGGGAHNIEFRNNRIYIQNHLLFGYYKDGSLIQKYGCHFDNEDFHIFSVEDIRGFRPWKDKIEYTRQREYKNIEFENQYFFESIKFIMDFVEDINKNTTEYYKDTNIQNIYLETITSNSQYLKEIANIITHPHKSTYKSSRLLNQYSAYNGLKKLKDFDYLKIFFDKSIKDTQKVKVVRLLDKEDKYIGNISKHWQETDIAKRGTSNIKIEDDSINIEQGTDIYKNFIENFIDIVENIPLYGLEDGKEGFALPIGRDKVLKIEIYKEIKVSIQNEQYKLIKEEEIIEQKLTEADANIKEQIINQVNNFFYKDKNKKEIGLNNIDFVEVAGINEKNEVYLILHDGENKKYIKNNIKINREKQKLNVELKDGTVLKDNLIVEQDKKEIIKRIKSFDKNLKEQIDTHFIKEFDSNKDFNISLSLVPAKGIEFDIDLNTLKFFESYGILKEKLADILSREKSSDYEDFKKMLESLKGLGTQSIPVINVIYSDSKYKLSDFYKKYLYGKNIFESWKKEPNKCLLCLLYYHSLYNDEKIKELTEKNKIILDYLFFGKDYVSENYKNGQHIANNLENIHTFFKKDPVNAQVLTEVPFEGIISFGEFLEEYVIEKETDSDVLKIQKQQNKISLVEIVEHFRKHYIYSIATQNNCFVLKTFLNTTFNDVINEQNMKLGYPFNISNFEKKYYMAEAFGSFIYSLNLPDKVIENLFKNNKLMTLTAKSFFEIMNVSKNREFLTDDMEVYYLVHKSDEFTNKKKEQIIDKAGIKPSVNITYDDSSSWLNKIVELEDNNNLKYFPFVGHGSILGLSVIQGGDERIATVSSVINALQNAYKAEDISKVLDKEQFFNNLHNKEILLPKSVLEKIKNEEDINSILNIFTKALKDASLSEDILFQILDGSLKYDITASLIEAQNNGVSLNSIVIDLGSCESVYFAQSIYKDLIKKDAKTLPVIIAASSHGNTLSHSASENIDGQIYHINTFDQKLFKTLTDEGSITYQDIFSARENSTVFFEFNDEEEKIIDNFKKNLELLKFVNSEDNLIKPQQHYLELFEIPGNSKMSFLKRGKDKQETKEMFSNKWEADNENPLFYEGKEYSRPTTSRLPSTQDISLDLMYDGKDYPEDYVQIYRKIKKLKLDEFVDEKSKDFDESNYAGYNYAYIYYLYKNGKIEEIKDYVEDKNNKIEYRLYAFMYLEIEGIETKESIKTELKNSFNNKIKNKKYFKNIKNDFDLQSYSTGIMLLAEDNFKEAIKLVIIDENFDDNKIIQSLYGKIADSLFILPKYGFYESLFGGLKKQVAYSDLSYSTDYEDNLKEAIRHELEHAFINNLGFENISEIGLSANEVLSYTVSRKYRPKNLVHKINTEAFSFIPFNRESAFAENFVSLFKHILSVVKEPATGIGLSDAIIKLMFSDTDLENKNVNLSQLELRNKIFDIYLSDKNEQFIKEFEEAVNEFDFGWQSVLYNTLNYLDQTDKNTYEAIIEKVRNSGIKVDWINTSYKNEFIQNIEERIEKGDDKAIVHHIILSGEKPNEQILDIISDTLSEKDADLKLLFGKDEEGKYYFDKIEKGNTTSLKNIISGNGTIDEETKLFLNIILSKKTYVNRNILRSYISKLGYTDNISFEDMNEMLSLGMEQEVFEQIVLLNSYITDAAKRETYFVYDDEIITNIFNYMLQTNPYYFIYEDINGRNLMDSIVKVLNPFNDEHNEILKKILKIYNPNLTNKEDVENFIKKLYLRNSIIDANDIDNFETEVLTYIDTKQQTKIFNKGVKYISSETDEILNITSDLFFNNVESTTIGNFIFSEEIENTDKKVVLGNSPLINPICKEFGLKNYEQYYRENFEEYVDEKGESIVKPAMIKSVPELLFKQVAKDIKNGKIENIYFFLPDNLDSDNFEFTREEITILWDWFNGKDKNLKDVARTILDNTVFIYGTEKFENTISQYIPKFINQSMHQRAKLIKYMAEQNSVNYLQEGVGFTVEKLLKQKANEFGSIDEKNDNYKTEWFNDILQNLPSFFDNRRLISVIDKLNLNNVEHKNILKQIIKKQGNIDKVLYLIDMINLTDEKKNLFTENKIKFSVRNYKPIKDFFNRRKIGKENIFTEMEMLERMTEKEKYIEKERFFDSSKFLTINEFLFDKKEQNGTSIVLGKTKLYLKEITDVAGLKTWEDYYENNLSDVILEYENKKEPLIRDDGITAAPEILFFQIYKDLKSGKLKDIYFLLPKKIDEDFGETNFTFEELQILLDMKNSEDKEIKNMAEYILDNITFIVGTESFINAVSFLNLNIKDLFPKEIENLLEIIIDIQKENNDEISTYNKSAILLETEEYVNKAVSDGKSSLITALGVAVKEFLEVYKAGSFYKGHKGTESRLRALMLSSASYLIPGIIGVAGILMPAIPLTTVLIAFIVSIFATNIGLHILIDFKAIRTRQEMIENMRKDMAIEIELKGNKMQVNKEEEEVMPVYVISEDLGKLGYDSKELRNTGLKTGKGESVFAVETEGAIVLGTRNGAGAKEIAQVLNESKVLKELIKDKISGKIQVSDMDIIVEDEKYIEQKQKEKDFKGSDIIFEEGIMIVKELKGQSRQEIMEEFKKLSEVKQAIGITLADKMIISLEDIKDIEKLKTAINSGRARKVITRQQSEQLGIGEKELLEIRKKGIEVYIKEGEKVIEFDTRKEIETEAIFGNITMQQLQQKIINSEKPLLIGIEKLAGMFKSNQADIIETYSMFETLIGNFKMNFGIGQLKQKDVEAMAYNVRYEEIPVSWEDLKESSEIKIMYNNIGEGLKEVFKGAIEERILAKQEIGENRLSDKKLERLLGKMLKKQKEKKIGKKKFNYEDDEKFTIEDGKREIYEIMAERNINEIEDEESILKIIELIPVVADRQMSISEEISREDIAKDYRAMLSAA